MKIKYNAIKNAKMIKEMEPTEVDKVLIWIFLFTGMFFYEFYPEKESLLGLLSFALVYKFFLYFCWCVCWIIQAIYCKKHNLNFDGTPKLNNDNNK